MKVTRDYVMSGASLEAPPGSQMAPKCRAWPSNIAPQAVNEVNNCFSLQFDVRMSINYRPQNRFRDAAETIGLDRRQLGALSTSRPTNQSTWELYSSATCYR